MDLSKLLVELINNLLSIFLNNKKEAKENKLKKIESFKKDFCSLSLEIQQYKINPCSFGKNQRKNIVQKALSIKANYSHYLTSEIFVNLGKLIDTLNTDQSIDETLNIDGIIMKKTDDYIRSI